MPPTIYNKSIEQEKTVINVVVLNENSIFPTILALLLYKPTGTPLCDAHNLDSTKRAHWYCPRGRKLKFPNKKKQLKDPDRMKKEGRMHSDVSKIVVVLIIEGKMQTNVIASLCRM